MNTPPPEMTLDHYRDAVALLRATLAGDEAALLAIFRSCDIVRVFQAVVRLHLTTLLDRAGGHPDIVDNFLQDFLTQASDVQDQP